MHCRLKSTPLLLAASSGALSTLKCLIDLGAYVLRCDENGNNAVHLAAMRYHANVLEFFIQWNHAEVDVWNTLVGTEADHISFCST
jgi:ankyrin repeat protein